ncbi:MAG: hypothetical protein WAM92_05255, partial [Mycobacterium sp.]
MNVKNKIMAAVLAAGAISAGIAVASALPAAAESGAAEISIPGDPPDKPAPNNDYFYPPLG